MKLLNAIKTDYKIFSASRKSGTYLYDRSQLTSEPEAGADMSVPLNIDTEFLGQPSKWYEDTLGRRGITCQVKGINVSEGLIFSHPDSASLLPRFKVLKHGFDPVDYLEALGHDVSLSRCEDWRYLNVLKTCEFVLYAHFALAEICLIGHGKYRDDIVDLMAERCSNKPHFEMKRRLIAKTPGTQKGGDKDHIKMKWILTLNGEQYRVAIAIVDTGALHGIASYADLGAAAGVKLLAKDNLTQLDKENMLDTAINRPEDFDSYALGDLMCYDILEANAENFKRVYKAVGVEDSFTPPKLTIGSTVKDLFIAALFNHLGVETDKRVQKAFIEKYLEVSSASSLRKNPNDTSALLSKVEGGRCRNNRVLTINICGVVIDIDISGCYGEGMRNQDYYVGVPEILSFPANSKVNDYWTLEEFLKAYKSDLVAGGWFARVSATEDLTYPQDYFASWFVGGNAGEDLLCKYAQQNLSDTDKEALEFNEEDGTTKIFNHQIHNAVLTQDGLDWIDNVASEKQRKELYKKLIVKAAIVYPKAWKVDNLEELEEAYSTHDGKNTRKRVGGLKKKLQATDGECHAWLSVNMGELIVDDLLFNRKQHPKKTPLNTLFKLCTNTLYGDMTSKYFASANVVVGNNITARARALAWFMEKGFYGVQTVTDGCAFDPNRVPHPSDGRRLNGTNLVNLWQVEDNTVSNRRIVLSPLGGVSRTYQQWVDLGMETINSMSMEHLQNLFDHPVLKAKSTTLEPKEVDGVWVKSYRERVGQFIFEMKDFYESGTFHGTSNYFLDNADNPNLKARAYETKKKHQAIDEVGSVMVESDRYLGKNNPVIDFIKQIKGHPNKVTRQQPFIKQGILKVGDYRNRLETWKSLNLVPGDSYYKSGMLREFSLSQFTFKTLEQYNQWQKSLHRSKEEFGQMVEDFFTDEDGCLDYELMINTVARLISEGVMNPLSALHGHRNTGRVRHPKHNLLMKVREKLKTPVTEVYSN